MALSQERKGTIAVSLTNFLDSGCIVASGVALAAWAIAFNFDNVWAVHLGRRGRECLRRGGGRAHRRLSGRPLRAQVHLHLQPARVRYGRVPHYVRGELAHALRRHRHFRPVRGRRRTVVVELHLRDVLLARAAPPTSASASSPGHAARRSSSSSHFCSRLSSRPSGRTARFCRRAPTGPSTACSPCACCSSSCSWWRSVAWNLQRKLEESKDWTGKAGRGRRQARHLHLR